MNNAFINRPTTVKTRLSVALTALTTVGTGIALPNFAYAQLEEVVVTARARSESLQDVPSTVNKLIVKPIPVKIETPYKLSQLELFGASANFNLIET